MEDEWAGDATDYYVDRVLDFLLANYAERWLENRSVKPDSVSDFLVDTLQSHFDADIDASVCFPVAKLMTVLFDETRLGVLTGVTHVLGEEHVQHIMSDQHKLQEQEPAEKQPVESVAPAAEPVQAEKQLEQPVVAQAEEEEEDDGWIQVKSKKSQKKRGKRLD